jgi:hypothetical protein
MYVTSPIEQCPPSICGYPASSFDDGVPNILGEIGFEVDVLERHIEDALLTGDLLSYYDQLWIISSAEDYFVVFSEQEIQVVLDFHAEGNGIYIAADNAGWGYYAATANLISENFGVEFCCIINHTGGIVHDCKPILHEAPGHHIMNGVDYLLLSRNDASMIVTSPSVLIASHSGYPVIAALDNSSGRVVFDINIIRALENYSSLCDNTVFFKNVANWLAGKDRIVSVYFDIHPGSCPNPLNVKKYRVDNARSLSKEVPGTIESNPENDRGVLPVAILGSEDFDVKNIDPTTISLVGISPLRWNNEDVATPIGDDAEECECTTQGPDGYDDLTLKFDADEIVPALGEVQDGDIIPLTITGELMDGTPIEGGDCVLIRGRHRDDRIVIADITSYPNPFNPVTTISFALESESHVKMDVFNITGQLVSTLVDQHLEAGQHSVIWDSKDNSGQTVSSGIYFYRVQADEFSQTQKMVLLK